MDINWITVTAQIVNFLVLVWLLQKFLYHPIVDAMDKRQQQIADRVKAAEEREQAAATKVQRFQEKEDALAEQTEQILERSRAEVSEKKRQLMDDARREVNEARAQWQQQLTEEKQAFIAGLRRLAAEGVTTVATQVLKELADSQLESQIVSRFIDELASLTPDVRRRLADVRQPVRVFTAFELDEEVSERVVSALRAHLANDLQIHFERSADPLCGIELDVDGYRIDWNFAAFMEQLDERIDAALDSLEPAKSDAV